jgi:hypothetical protein
MVGGGVNLRPEEEHLRKLSPFAHFEAATDFLCVWYWGLNSGPHTSWAGTLPLEPLLQPSNINVPVGSRGVRSGHVEK